MTDAFVENDDEWVEMLPEGAEKVPDGRAAVHRLVDAPPNVQRQGVSLLIAPAGGPAVAQVRLQMSTGPRVYAKDPRTGEPLLAPMVILQQISVRPSERGRRHPARIFDEMDAAAAELARRLMIQSVLSPRLRRMLGKMGAAELPYTPDSFVYRRTTRADARHDDARAPKRSRLGAALRDWYMH